MSSDLEGDLNGDGIVDEMDRVRSDLGGDIDQLGEGMRKMFDWQAYVRSAPLTSAAAAVVLGFLIAPRLGSGSAAAAVPSFGSAPTPPATPYGSVSKMLTTMVLGGLMRTGSAYLADFLTRQLGTPSPAESEDSEPPESAQPF